MAPVFALRGCWHFASLDQSGAYDEATVRVLAIASGAMGDH